MTDVELFQAFSTYQQGRAFAPRDREAAALFPRHSDHRSRTGLGALPSSEGET